MLGAEDDCAIEIELADPREALDALEGLPHRFLLHTGLDDPRSRWSFFGADPTAVFRGEEIRDAMAMRRAVTGARHRHGLAPVSTGARPSHDPGRPPFAGGLVGYWSYDYGRRLERLPSHARDDLGLPDAVIGMYDVVGAWDRRTRRAWLQHSHPLGAASPPGRKPAGSRLREFAARFEAFARDRRATRSAAALPFAGSDRRAGITSTFDDACYRCAVDQIKDHIRRGDLFQANLSRRWTVVPGADRDAIGALRLAPELFAALDRRSPAPFAAYFDAGDHVIVSASPERFLELRGSRVETRPIKGTRPRGFCPAEDEQLAAELLASAKDRAENVMIVDVLRNDLGRVCETGSVETLALCELERFPQVLHLTSTVAGVLRPGLDAFDLLHAAFPGGSITGAPKIRAMEILDALEPVRRHVYTGAIGYLDWSGDADWSIAIRTALVTRDAIHFSAGGGITADSDPEAERLETLDKAEGLRLALAELMGPVTLSDEAAAR